MKDDNWGKYLQIGLELAASVLIFLIIGLFLDSKFNTKPYLTILGTFAGILSVFYILWKKFLKGDK